MPQHNKSSDKPYQPTPALRLAQQIQRDAASKGFVWADIGELLDKFEEELGELREAVEVGTIAEKADELGDLLFVLANLGGVLGLDCEDALRGSCLKFNSRFSGMEAGLKVKNEVLSDLTLGEMTELWNVQKRRERSPPT